MFYFLVVEDTKDSITAVTKLLATGFPQSRIDVAETVRKGLKLIQKASREERPYHAAILDLKLPYDKGAELKADTSLCCTIKDTKSPTLVIHWTAYPQDADLTDHLIKFHVEPDDPRAALVSKLEVDWPEKLLSKLRAYLYGAHIRKQISSIFGEKSGSIMSTKGYMTHDLNALFRSIIEYWDYLDVPLRDEIKGLFQVDTRARPIRIGLVKDVEKLGT